MTRIPKMEPIWRAVEVTREGQTVRLCVEMEYEPPANMKPKEAKDFAARIPESADLWLERLGQILLKESTFWPSLKLRDLKFSAD